MAFCQDKIDSGKWLVKVNDGMGHTVRAETMIDGGPDPSEIAKGSAGNNSNAIEETPKWIRILFGLSILLNLFLGLYIWKSRSSRR